MKSITGIACVDSHCYYANKEGGPLAWPHTEGDLDWFKYITNGGILVVGNNTWKELQKLPPLKNREIWPVGRDHELKSVYDVMTKFRLDSTNRQMFIGGGGQLWHDFFDYYDIFYLTVLKKQWIEDGLKLDLCDFTDNIIENSRYTIYAHCK